MRPVFLAGASTLGDQVQPTSLRVRPGQQLQQRALLIGSAQVRTHAFSRQFSQRTPIERAARRSKLNYKGSSFAQGRPVTRNSSSQATSHPHNNNSAAKGNLFFLNLKIISKNIFFNRMASGRRSVCYLRSNKNAL